MRDWLVVASVLGIVSLLWVAGMIVGFGFDLFP